MSSKQDDNALVPLLKSLTVIPLIIFFYYYDFFLFRRWFLAYPLSSFFIAATVLVCLGILMRWKVISTLAQVSAGSTTWGFFFLMASVVFYLYGSNFSSSTLLFHYESLVLMVYAYVLFMFGARLAWVALPLVVVEALVPLFGEIEVLLGNTLALVVVAGAIFILFASFVRFRPYSLALPAAVIALLLAAVSFPALEILQLGAPLCLVLLIPTKTRELFSGSRPAVKSACQNHVVENGFCLICGSRIPSESTISPSMFASLLLIVLIVVATVLVQVPLLAFYGAPAQSYITYRGYVANPIPGPPTGWLVNQSTIQSYNSDVYAIKQVYVPITYPERSNYTLYYELSRGSPYVVNSFGNIPGYNRISNLTQVGNLRGYVTVYNSSYNLMVVFPATTQLTFWNGSGFITLNNGITILRNFTGTNITAAENYFVGDLNSLFLPEIQSQSFFTSWTSYYSTLNSISNSLLLMVEALCSSAAIFGVAVVASRLDGSVEDSWTKASALSEKDWRVLNAFLESRGTLTTEEIYSKLMPAEEAGTELTLNTVLESVKGLETKGLVRRNFVQRDGSVQLSWKVSF